MNEEEKMQAGLWYDANYDQSLVEKRLVAEGLCFEFNHTSPVEKIKQAELLKQLFPSHGNDVVVLSPIFTDYGVNTHLGAYTFVNHGAYFMDGAPITIGEHCFIGPNCGFYTANHPLNAEQRNQGLEQAQPIAIGNNVWIGADVTILPGVTIGEGTVIGAKSLVTKDIPAHVVAVGNPCRVVRPITDEDRIK